MPVRHEMFLHALINLGGAECEDGVLGMEEPSPRFAEQHA